MVRLPKLSALIGGAILIAACGSIDTSDQDDLATPEVLSSMSEPGVVRSIVRLTGEIYRFRNNNHTGLLLVTDEGIALIDPLNVPTADWLAGEIESLFDQPVTHVLYTHGHQDHASGAAAFDGAEIISHENIYEVITPAEDEPLPGRYAALDANSSGQLSPSELLEDFAAHDLDGNGVVTGAEAFAYFYKDVTAPTLTFNGDLYRLEVGGQVIEMHYVGGNHASDMSYIFFPKEKLVFYVDVISLGAIPFGALPWYSLEDTANTYGKALAIDADIAVPSHGPIGVQDDVRALQTYMNDLRLAVKTAMDEGLALEEMQSKNLMEAYSNWDFYDQRIAQNIEGMHRALMSEKEAE